MVGVGAMVGAGIFVLAGVAMTMDLDLPTVGDMGELPSALPFLSLYGIGLWIAD